MGALSNTGGEGSNDAEKVYSRLEFTKISFPSDRLTILALRQLHPTLFDHGLRQGLDSQPFYFRRDASYIPGAEELADILFSERLVAAYAYGRACGLQDPDGYEGDLGLQGFQEDLIRDYVKFGLATGEHQATEMIREIERQARGMNRENPR